MPSSPAASALPRLPRRTRSLVVDAAYCCALAGLVAWLARSFDTAPRGGLVFVLLGGVPTLATLRLLAGVVSDFPPAARREWREQLALAGVGERAWWNATAGSLLARAGIPAALAQAGAAIALIVEEQALRHDGVYTTVALAMLLPTAGWLLPAVGAMSAFRGMCRGRSAPLALAAPWAIAGVGLIGGFVSACIALRLREEFASNLSTTMFAVAAAAAAYRWRTGSRGILDFE